MRIRPNSLGFTLLLGALAALPPLAIDMGLPALVALGTSFNTSSAATGLTISGRTATAMTSVMSLFALASFAAYATIVRPAEQADRPRLQPLPRQS